MNLTSRLAVPGAICILARVPSRRAQLGLFLACLVTFAWFHQGGGWNQNARFAEVRAIVEQGRFAMDDYLVYFPADAHGVLERARVENGGFTRDGRLHLLAWDEKSTRAVNGSAIPPDAVRVVVGKGTCSGDVGFGPDGHFHPNKPPGTTLAAVPVYFAAHRIGRALGLDPDHWWVLTVNAWLCSALTVGAASAAGVVLLWRAGLAMFPGSRGALPAALVFGFGTTFFPFATLMFDHNLTAVLLLAAFAAVRGGRPLAAGMCAGAAALTNYLAGIPGVIFGVWVLGRDRRNGSRAALRYLLGVLPCFIALLCYNAAALGSVLALNTSFQNPAFVEDSPAFLGMFVAPQWFAALALMLSPWRGVFCLSPVLVLAVAALLRWPPRIRAERRVILAVAAFFFTVAVCFNGFHGGYAAGPRYLIPALPFLALALVPAFERWRKSAALLGAFSVLQQSLLTATDAQNPLGVGDHAWRDHPGEWIEKLAGNSLVWRHAWPLFAHGRAWPAVRAEFDEWAEKNPGADHGGAWRRVVRGEADPVPLAAMPGPVSVNVTGMWDGAHFALHPPHSPQSDRAAWNAGELLWPGSRWSLAPLCVPWLAWLLARRR